MVLFASALDLGRVFYSQITIDNAAKEGALEAGRNPTQFDNTKPCDPKTNRVICLVINEAKGSFYTISPADVSLTCSVMPCPADPVVGNTVTVSVVGHFSLITPILAIFTGGQDLTLHASATAQVGVAPYPAPASAVPSDPPSASPSTDPSASPSASPSSAPSASPTCDPPSVTGNTKVSPSSGVSGNTSPPATLFTFTAPTVKDQLGCTFLYSWSFGDGANASTATETHYYRNKGGGRFKDYTVTLVIATIGVPTTWTDTLNVTVNP
jgi:hypothetical protein